MVFTAIAMQHVIDKDSNSPVPYYAPADTMRFSLPTSSYFCERVTLRDDSNVSATMFMLKKKPILTGLNRFNLSTNSSIKPRDYNHQMYYLYPSANFTLHACVVSEPVDFYIIQGERNFNAWKDDPKGGSWEKHLHISKACPETMVQSFNFTGLASEYYFAFYNFGSNSSTVRATLYFERPEYITADNSIVKLCQAGGETESNSCSMGIPLTFNYYMLLIVDYPSDGNWTTQVRVDWSCTLRASVCVAQILGITLFWLVMFVCCCVVVISCCCGSQHRKAYEPLN